MTLHEPAATVLFDAVFGSPACGYCLVGPTNRVLRVNAEWLRLTGFEAGQAIGHDIVELFPDTRDLSMALHELARSGRHVHVPKHAQTIAGVESWWDGWISPVPFDAGTGLLIAARQLLEVEGQRDPAAVSAIFDTIEDVIYAKDARGRLVYANPGALALIGKPLDAVVGRTDAQFLADPQAAHTVMENDRAVMLSGKPADVEEHVPSPDGTERIWLSRKVPWRHSDGRVIGLLGISRDITRRKLDERELRQMRSLMKSTLDNFPTAITFKDRDGRFIEVNRAVQEMFGRPREALLGLAPHDFLPPQLADRILADEAAVLADGRARQIEHEREIAGRRSVFLDTMFPLTAEDDSVYGVGYISHDITAQKQAEQDLKSLNEQLLDVAQQKDQFIATLGHELRNPLAPIRTAAELILLKGRGDPAFQRPAEIIRRQAEHLTHLVDDLLDVSRVTFGTVHLRREPVDLAALAVSAAETGQSEFDAKGIAFETRIVANPRVQGDVTRLAQCLANLLGNAVKFTPSGGSVQLRVGRESGQAVLEVQDSGSGIDPGNTERIFDLFVQEHRSGQHGNKGLGIGLALTRRLVALHGGTVTAHSEGVGRGSLFVVRLPLLQDDRAADSGPLPQDDAGRAASGATVLVVDDNEDAAETVAEMLRLSGFSVRTAPSGEAALEWSQAESPDAIVLDIGLPGIDGYEVCRRLRRRTGPPPVLIALTGWGQDGDRDAAGRAGFDRHFTKPVDVAQLTRALDELLRRRAAG